MTVYKSLKIPTIEETEVQCDHNPRSWVGGDDDARFSYPFQDFLLNYRTHNLNFVSFSYTLSATLAYDYA